MPYLSSHGKITDEGVIWVLEGNQLDFTFSEFTDLMGRMMEAGLFTCLKDIRPALYGQILELYKKELYKRIEEDDLEHVLEQTLFQLKDSLRM